MSATEIDDVIELPVLPLRDVVVFPHMVIPLFVGREKSIAALEEAMADEKKVFLVAQKDANDDDPAPKDLYEIGTIATILQMLKLPDGTVKVLVEGLDRARIEDFIDQDEMLVAQTSIIEVEESEGQYDDVVESAIEEVEKYVKQSKKLPSEVLNAVKSITSLDRLTDTLASHISSLKVSEKQALLEMSDPLDRYDEILGIIDRELDVVQVDKRIRGRVKKQMEKSQREYYLNEQIKAIHKELGEMDEGSGELDELEKKIQVSGMPKEARDKAGSELKKLRMMSPMSAEASVVRGYLDWLVNVPWKKRSKVRLDLQRAEEVLNEDHYGLEEVKDRIIEYLAVQKRVKKLKGPVLCLVGPPGVGKTSLGQSIARSTNRKFVRMALGGVRDESEIRGHRRTYIGSMPGKLIQKMSKVGVKNPLFLLDEIDKMGMDNRGDPASALLEVLDPEQNNSFNDHYMEVDYDLSDVMFVCTSNSMNIPAPLLDRMEVIRIPGYTEDEKVNIAQKYLIPKQCKNNGLKEGELELPEASLRHLIRHYTRESGVRGLEREIAKVCRKVVKAAALGKEAVAEVQPEALEDLIGVQKFKYGIAEEENKVGQVTGLAWTQVGGELLTIEAVTMPGKGRTIKTGSLGDVMQESIQAATTVVRSRSKVLGIPEDFYEKQDLHIHVPEGATPKDGPSAGTAMCTAMVSVLTGVPVRCDVAMTGEITLRGQVLPIGGLKEKLLAAHRGGIKTVIIPDDNIRDLKEIPEHIKEDLEIRAVKWIDEVLDIALEYLPEPGNESINEASAEAENGNDRINAH
ncbi:endopeptidase La [Litoribrevibacter albus]|uniref:Lon protease n=1 Tax=Litoribrevibacter albus TaxID=1473156 RepID=A0AA37SAA9_9GAMM|nr:endopeptidase La [Litoribrevibacter albus]GLQ32287.1 Lon protease [Litoribrevibacter albus]